MNFGEIRELMSEEVRKGRVRERATVLLNDLLLNCVREARFVNLRIMIEIDEEEGMFEYGNCLYSRGGKKCETGIFLERSKLVYKVF